MKIEHIALYTQRLEEMKNFYTRYFSGQSNDKYVNARKGFSSYFISFSSGARLELMQQEGITPAATNNKQRLGLIHFAFSVGSRAAVDALTETLRTQGFKVTGEPRSTGDGYYESCIADPDGNLVEITE
ncbi:VOC family protein [Azotosporobacter soli]|uniref:VOC family protein n=1 Tax=Azotosporobacter soli TaxID=3055040 RepID=UPI0031FEC4A9